MSEFYDYSITTLQGQTRSLSDYRGEVVLLVNTASQCGFTPQYRALEALFQQYVDAGLMIIGFPCNQFGHQEPGDSAEIQKFCETKFSVTFPLSHKIEVNGPNADLLFKWLTKQLPGLLGPSIKWNFTKFLINRNGEPVKRFAPLTKPEKIEGQIRQLLGL